MKKLLLAICVIMWSLNVSADFVPGTEDVPAIDDMVFSEDVVSFDVPEGQILNVVAQTKKSASQIQQFYATNLNAMGWQKSGTNRFVRGRDVLELEIASEGNKRIVRFNLLVPSE